jgi:hypothetical protein
MRIEVDTQRDSKEELFHLANMLRAISGSKESVVFREPKTQKSVDMFSDSPQPTATGLFDMFNSDAQAAPQQSAPVETESSKDLFSIFNSAPATPQQAATPILLNDPILDTESVEPVKRTTARDILEDDRITPY